MRTSLIEIKQIEDLILEKGDYSERLVTEAKVLTSPDAAEKVHWQTKSYELIWIYGREKLRKEIMEVEHLLFKKSKYTFFQNIIRSIFK